MTRLPEPEVQFVQAEDASPLAIAVMPNQCWAQAVIPVRPTTAHKELTVRDASMRYEVVPAVLRQAQKSVVVQDAAQAFVVAPARFKTVTEQVLVSEEVRRLVREPAVFEKRVERVEVESARVELRECRGAGAAPAGLKKPSAAALCAVEIPARYQAVSRLVEVQPERVREEIVPPIYKTVTRRVLEQDAQVVSESIPEKRIELAYQTVQEPSAARAQVVPAQTQQLAVKTHEGRPQLSWRQVVCEQDVTPGLVMSVQKALLASGVDSGKVDGKLGARTWQALQTYQQREGLAGGYLTHESLESLGVAFAAQ